MVNGQMTVLGSRTDANDYRYQMDITSEGAVPISGTVGISGSITIGSVSAHVDSIYVTSGVTYIQDKVPTSSYANNAATVLEYITSGTSTGISTGSVIGTIVKFIGAGSYVQVLTYSNDNITAIGSWS